MNREEIKARVAHLMSMGNDPRTNQFEAEAALRQAAKLMRLHAIEQVELQDATGNTPQFDWMSINVPFHPKGAAVPVTLFGSLGVGIANFTDCKASWSRTEQYGYCLRFDGDATDVYFAVYLAKHLRDSIRRESTKFVGTRREKETFRRAMAGRIHQRMDEIRKAQQAEMRAAATTSRALVLVDNKIALRDQHFGKPSYGKSERRNEAFAREAGLRSGDKVDFNRPLANTPEDQPQIGRQ